MMHMLALSNIEEGFRFITKTFDCDVGTTSIKEESTKELLLQSLDRGHIHVILVKSSAWPSLLFPSSQLILAVDKVETVVRRAVSAGGKVLEHSIVDGNALFVIQGPPLCDALRLVIAEANSPVGGSTEAELVNTLTTWCSGSFSSFGGPSAHSAKTLTTVNHSNAWTPPRGPSIPTIFPSVLHDGAFCPIPPNASSPIPFKTEYFEGEVLLLVKTTPLVPQYKHIFQKVSEFTNKAGTMTFEVQCQGKFTKIPQGRLYIGAEITKKMNLGLFTRGICATVLQFINTINPFIHSSFGDKENAELPHITGPLWCMADKIVVTPPGSTPPKMGQLFPEDKEARARRRSRFLHEETIDLNSTYSFSVNTDNIELCDWNMVNLPITSSMDLHTFWDDADIRLCCYCVPSPAGERPPSAEELDSKSAKALAKSLPKYHYQATNQYLLCVQIEHLSNHPGRAPNSGSEIGESKEASTLMNSPTPEPYFNLDDDGGENDVADDTSDDSDDDLFFDAVEGSVSGEGGGSRDFTRSLCRSKVLSKRANGALVLVPAVIVASDVVRKRSFLGVGSSRRELYVFCVPVEVLMPNKETMQTLDYFVTIRSYKDFTTAFDVSSDYKSCAYSRMSRTEQRRHDLCSMMSQVLSLASSDEALRYRLITFFSVSTHTDYFLLAEAIRSMPGSKNGVGNPRLRADLEKTILKEGFVCTRQGQTHWSEEYMCVTSEELIFIQHSTALSDKKRRRIPLEYIVSHRVIDASESSFPLEDCYCILLSTFPKEFSVLIRGRAELDRWLAVLSGLLEETGRRAMNSDLPLANSFKQLELLSHPMDWQMGSRVLLNGRRFCGRDMLEAPAEAEDMLSSKSFQLEKEVERQSVMIFNNTISVEIPTEINEFGCYTESTIELSDNVSKSDEETIDVSHTSRNFPLLLVKKALQLISEISFYSNSMDSSISWENFLENHWIEFLDVVSLLPCIDLDQYALSNEEHICLFLNLYHTMLLHAVLIAGVPSTLMKWPSFFNSFSYEAFGDMFSLADLEHSVIKGAFKTNGIIPQVVIRQTKYEFALSVKDMRLLFAVNCGSMSMPSAVPIFQPDELEDQLDDCVRRCLRKQLHVSRGSGKMYVVRLPLLCEWYEADVLELCNNMAFSSEYKKSTKLLRLFINYCGKEQKDILLELITNDKASYSFKFSKFDFRCRILKIMSESLHEKGDKDQENDLFFKRATV